MYAPMHIYIYTYIYVEVLQYFFLCVVEPTAETHFSEAKSSEPAMKTKKVGKCQSTQG